MNASTARIHAGKAARVTNNRKRAETTGVSVITTQCERFAVPCASMSDPHCLGTRVLDEHRACDGYNADAN
jgi:hypothetical protein